jgi:prolyl oligopeptidase
MGAMSSKSTSSPWDPSKFKYPKARREDCYDTYVSSKRGKIKILDAYRWLEEPPDKSIETEHFIRAQDELTQRYLAQDPNRDAFKEKLTENWNYARCESSPPWKS